MLKIAMAGGPSSGKSSLSRQLTTELYNNRKLNCQLVTEHAREYINQALMHGKFVPTMSDQFMIFNKQVEKEDIVPSSCDYLITDSPIFLPLIFAYNLCDMKNFQQRTAYLSLYETFLAKHINRYDHILYLPRKKDFFKDGTRHETAEQADQIGIHIVAFLRSHNIKFHQIEAKEDEDRLKEALKIIGI